VKDSHINYPSTKSRFQHQNELNALENQHLL